MTWTPYLLDNIAQEIVIDAIQRDKKENTNSLMQAHRLRGSCAYGLERFWGEQVRLLNESTPDEKSKGKFTQDVWLALAAIMKTAGIILPAESIDPPPKGGSSTESRYLQQVQEACCQIRSLDKQEIQASLAVLASLCDAIVWWKQRLAKRGHSNV
jgi:hypothetical protein